MAKAKRPTHPDESTSAWGIWTPNILVTPGQTPFGDTGFEFAPGPDSTPEYWRADLVVSLWNMMLLARAWGTPHFTPEGFGKGWTEHFKELVTTYGAKAIGFYITGLQRAILSDATLAPRFRDDWLRPLYWALRFDLDHGLDERDSAELDKTLDVMWPLVMRVSAEAEACALPRPGGVKADAAVTQANNPGMDAGAGAADDVKQCRHSDDFTSVVWFGEQYIFTAGHQAGAVRLLWEQWERGTPTLCQDTIAEDLGAEGAFRLANVFRERRPVPGRMRRVKYAQHPAWGKMIVSVGRGTFALKEPAE